MATGEPSARLEAIALPGMPLVRPGDDLAGLIADALARAGLALAAGDVLVVAQKIVSKAEGRLVRLDTVEPSDKARRLAARAGKDPRLVEVILSESREVLRVRDNLIIARHRLGMVMANAGVDHSNVEGAEGEAVLMLPEDPDASCARLGAALAAQRRLPCRRDHQRQRRAGVAARPDRHRDRLLGPRQRCRTCAAGRTCSAARCR